VKYLKSLIYFLFVAWAVPAAAETLTIVGTGDGMLLLQAVGRAFETSHPGNRIVVPESIGSSGGIRAVGNDEHGLGRVARDINDKEKPYGLTLIPYARVPVVFFTHPSNSVDGLSAEQVRGIFSGAIKDWSEVGGTAGTIRVVIREETDSSVDVLKKSFPGWSDITVTERSKMAATTQEAIEVVRTRERTIGFGPYPDAVQGKLKILKIDGRSPLDEGYPISTTLGLVFKASNRRGIVADFIDFIGSSEADEAIRQANGIPVN